MKRIEGQPILTAAQMRAAEQRAAPTPDAMYGLMERAGQGVAEAVQRLAAGAQTLILCGPGNNGGDGYVAARVLAERGHPVRVAALGEPATDLARRARTGWAGPVERFPFALPDDDVFAPVIVDAVFGTGLSRAPDEHTMWTLGALVRRARLSIAVDLPTGVHADTGEVVGHIPPAPFDLTLALGAPKPAHLLMPAIELCGSVRVVDLALAPVSPEEGWPDRVIAPPLLGAPPRSAHKYSRGLAVVISGAMPGAADLAVTAAMRAGAGYGVLFSDEPGGTLPHAIVQRRWSPDALAATVRGKDAAVIVIGPGLGRDNEARAKLEAAIACECPVIIDADALHLIDDGHFAAFAERGDEDTDGRVVLTPHAGEFTALFGKPVASKIDATREAARRSGATVVFKGADTVVAHPESGTSTLSNASSWLSTAGTGDVLAGTIAGVWHADWSSPAEAGVWLHAEAARRCGASFIADDLAHALTAARASL